MCFPMKDRHSTATALRAKPFTRSQVITVPHAMTGDDGSKWIDYESPLNSPESMVRSYSTEINVVHLPVSGLAGIPSDHRSLHALAFQCV